jgi:DNA-binding MarR family transcriptional regulator
MWHATLIPVSSTTSETQSSGESLLPEELLASPGFLLARVGGGMKMRVLDELEHAGCPGFQYGVLALLREGPAQTQARIADVLGVDRSQLVGELDELETSGLIERRRDPLDRRRHMVQITPKGKKELGKLRDLLLRIAEGNDARYRRRA